MRDYPPDDEHFGHSIQRKAAEMRHAAPRMFPLLLVKNDDSMGLMQIPLGVSANTWAEQIAGSVDAHTVSLGAVLYAEPEVAVWCYACQGDDDSGATVLGAEVADPYWRNILNGYAVLMRDLLIAHLPKPTPAPIKSEIIKHQMNVVIARGGLDVTIVCSCGWENNWFDRPTPEELMRAAQRHRGERVITIEHHRTDEWLPVDALGILNLIEPGAGGHTLMHRSTNTETTVGHSRLGVTITDYRPQEATPNADHD